MINSSVIALALILVFLVGVLLLIAHKGKPRLNKSYFKHQWSRLEANKTYSAAVITADALLDQALRQAHVKGETLGDRLKNTGLLSNLNGVWSAHKLRNQLVHEPDNQPTAIDCQKALRQYKRALQDLGAL